MKNKSRFALWCLVLLVAFNNVMAQNGDSLRVRIKEKNRNQISSSPPLEDTVVQNDVFEEEMEEPEEELEEEPVLREVSAQTIRKNKADPAFIYANDPRYWTQPNKKAPRQPWLLDLFGSNFFILLLYVLVGIVFLAVVYYMVVKNIGFLAPRNRRKKLAAAHEDDLDSTQHLHKWWSEAEQKGDFRTALRYRYIYLLHQLGERNLIHFAPEISNSRYLLDLHRNLPEEKRNDGVQSFRKIIRLYEYTWYGNLPLAEEQYRGVTQHIHSFSKQAGL